jgi:hypothetical protein
VPASETAALLRAVGEGVMPKASAAKKSNGQTKKAPARRSAAKAAQDRVKLGYVDANGISPSLYVLFERGAGKRPSVAKSMRGTVELRFKEEFTPVRIEFADDHVLVEDAREDEKRERADLVIQGSLPDIVQLASAPLVGGVPKLTDSRGRAALARVAGRRVKIEGSPLLARRLLKLLEI